MGCVVNGPGEAAGADLGIAAGRQGPPLRARQGRARRARGRHGHRARRRGREDRRRGHRGAPGAADENAEAIAAATREELLQIQGLDVNRSDEKIDKIREDRRLTRAVHARRWASTSTAPAAADTTPITAQTASPVMNDPSITPMPWKNDTRPTTRSTSPIALRIDMPAR